MYQYVANHIDEPSNAIMLLKTELNLVLCPFEVDPAIFFQILFSDSPNKFNLNIYIKFIRF